MITMAQQMQKRRTACYKAARYEQRMNEDQATENVLKEARYATARARQLLKRIEYWEANHA